MANLASYTIPNLIQGVSQQPDSQRDPTQGAIQINGMSSIAEGLRKRDHTRTLAKVSDTSFGDAFVHSILRDQSEEYLSVISNSFIKVYGLDGTEYPVSTAASGYSYLSSVVNARSQIRAVTVADYTFVCNLTASTAMDSAVAPETPRPSTHECLIWVRAANYGNDYKANVNGTQVSVTTPVAPVISSGTTVTENRISSEEIAANIATGLAGSGVSITQVSSVLWLQSPNPISVEVSDARANADITAILNEVQAFTELPTIAPVGYQVTISGDPGNNFDGYYVEFVPRDGTFNEGSWLETVGPGVEYKIDPSTMPHLLVRKSDGEFYFGPADGTTVAGIPGNLPSWGERTSGDYETSPDPSFIGFPINDVFIYKNRLGFLADENVILSRTREFFEFFPETVTTILDTDPIDLVASNNRVSVLRYAVPYQDELILFSAQYQFRFNAAETVLTPKTAQLTVLTQFEVDTDVRPQQAGGGIIFAQNNGDWTQMREFSVRGAGTALTADAQDLTGYVSAYVPSGIFKMTVNDTGNGLFAISGREQGAVGTGPVNYKNRIYVYKYFFRNSGSGSERAQSSWSYFELTGADEILQVLCVEEKLYLLVQYDDKVFLEVMSVMDRAEEQESMAPYPLLLDRRVTNTDKTPAPIRIAAATYDIQTNQTTFTLPFEARALTQIWTMWDLTEPNSTGPLFLGQTESGTAITCRGDYTGVDVVAGEPYQFRYRFTQFKAIAEVGGGKAARNVMRTQVRNAKLRYHETGFFQVKVMPEHRKEGFYTFDGTVSGVRNAAIGKPELLDASEVSRFYEGVFTIPIYGRGDRIYVELLNDRPIPCKFSTCEWVALLTSRAGSLQ